MIRFLHVMLRVIDLERSIEFYTKVFLLNIVRRSDYPDRKFSLVFLGHGTEEKDIIIELTYNWSPIKYEIGNGFGHIAFSVPDIYVLCDRAKTYGATIRREPGLLRTSGGKDVAFICDPDGYIIEIIQGS